MLNKLRRYRWIVLGRWKIKKQIKSISHTAKVKIIIGSGGTDYTGWIATDLPHFDILKHSDWEYFFHEHKIDNLLAEHVLEHLTAKDVDTVLAIAKIFLKKGGRFRIAVPDGFHPSPEYFDYVSPSGKTGAIHGHLFLWNYRLLSEAADRAGFKTELLEYYSEDKMFKSVPYSNEDGFITRSIKNNYVDREIKNYSSLVVDLINP